MLPGFGSEEIKSNRQPRSLRVHLRSHSWLSAGAKGNFDDCQYPPLDLRPPAARTRSDLFEDARVAASQRQPHLGAKHKRFAWSGGPRARTPKVCLCTAPSDCRRGCKAVRAQPRAAAATAVSREGSVGACAREARRGRDAAREAEARAGAAARRSRGPLQRAGGGAVPAAAQPQGAHELTRNRTVTLTLTLTLTLALTQGAQRGARRAARFQGGRGAEREAARAAVRARVRVRVRVRLRVRVRVRVA